MEPDFHIMIRRYGPTVHCSPVGELDLDTRPALERLWALPDGQVSVVVCDMRGLTFMDVTGLHRLLDMAAHIHGRGIDFFAYNWQRQPLRLLDLIDDLDPGQPGTGRRCPPTLPLRRTPTAGRRRLVH
ncbi:STAS domain-containing protein [Streptomyces sp. IBSNAI002]|uniref:STAS domain-containing protein n=1 Tax=Streptomyces sp. IBSNAI002 TaxID=3457500 RepID=UPI003FD60F70